MSNLVSILGLDKANIFLVVFNQAHAHPGSSSDSEFNADYVMSYDDAVAALAGFKDTSPSRPRSHVLWCDDFLGRFININLTGDTVDPFLFDREYGNGTFAGIITAIRDSL